MSESIVVLCNLPDRPSAQALAHYLVEARLAACVNIMAGCHSIYRWQGKIETAEEVPVLIKTTRAGYARLEAAIRERHPYKVPEIIALPIDQGLPAYLEWVRQETLPAP